MAARAAPLQRTHLRCIMRSTKGVTGAFSKGQGLKPRGLGASSSSPTCVSRYIAIISALLGSGAAFMRREPFPLLRRPATKHRTLPLIPLCLVLPVGRTERYGELGGCDGSRSSDVVCVEQDIQKGQVLDDRRRAHRTRYNPCTEFATAAT
jgi:hypothetical protein